MGSQAAPVSSEARALSDGLSWAQLSSNKIGGCKGGRWSALGQQAVFTVSVRQNLSSDSTLSQKQHDSSSARVAT